MKCSHTQTVWLSSDESLVLWYNCLCNYIIRVYKRKVYFLLFFLYSSWIIRQHHKCSCKIHETPIGNWLGTKLILIHGCLIEHIFIWEISSLLQTILIHGFKIAENKCPQKSINLCDWSHVHSFPEKKDVNYFVLDVKSCIKVYNGSLKWKENIKILKS